MKNSKSYKLFVAVVSTVILSFTVMDNNHVQENSIKLAFVTYNDFGNNLYLDNISIGTRSSYDLELTNITGIEKDTAYLPETSSVKVLPTVVITNVGYSSSLDSIMAYIKIDEISVFDSVFSPGIIAGGVSVVRFDSISIPADISFTVNTWISNPVDSNFSNDTITFSSVYKQGFRKKVLIETFTSATSYSSALNDPYLNFFVNQNFGNVNAVKYHRNVPEPGNDSMYLENPVQLDSLRDYYFNFQVPTSIMTGQKILNAPYSVNSNLQEPVNSELELGVPLNITVNDTIVNGIVTADINIEITSKLPDGNWKLKVIVAERYKSYDSIPVEWTQSEFFDVFKKAYPGISGVSIPVNHGTYNYQYNFPVEPQWADSLLYTLVYVQNDYDRMVINSGKSITDTMVGVNMITDNITQNLPGKGNYFGQFSVPSDGNFSGFGSDGSGNGFYLQNFEGGFMSGNWTRSQPIWFISFRESGGVNGTLFGGSNCIVMPFYEYRVRGIYDTLFSPVINGADSDDTLFFNYAYAQYLSTYSDSLKVLISTDGGVTYSNEIFNKGGEELATAPSTTITFSPTGANQWGTFIFPLQNIFTDENEPGISPETVELYQNYPNPFNPSTNIRFYSPGNSNLTLEIFDISGRLIKRLINNEAYNEGFHTVIFNATGLSSGVYFYRLSAGSFVTSRKMLLVK